MFDAEEQIKCGTQAAGQLARYVPPTKRQKLLQQKDVLEAQLSKVNDALKALDDHPELEQFINTIERANP